MAEQYNPLIYMFILLLLLTALSWVWWSYLYRKGSKFFRFSEKIFSTLMKIDILFVLIIAIVFVSRMVF